MDSNFHKHVDEALSRVSSLIRKTPLQYSPSLSEKTGSEVYLKLENFQVTGSFKARGAANKLMILSKDKPERIITASSGNHGSAVANAAAELGLEVLIFLPKTVSPAKLNKIKLFVAEVVLAEADGRTDAETAARQYAEENQLPYLSPYNDFDVITDHELHEEGVESIEGYDIVMTPSHPEYHTQETLDGLQNYVDDGGHFMYLGGNGFYWKVALNCNYPGAVEIRRAEGGIRMWASEPGESYNAFDGSYGGMWRRNGRPPQKLCGVGFTAQGKHIGDPYRRTEISRDPAYDWIFEGVEDELIGDFGFSGGGAAGFELDRADCKLGTPLNAVVLATSDRKLQLLGAADLQVVASVDLPAAATAGPWAVGKRVLVETGQKHLLCLDPADNLKVLWTAETNGQSVAGAPLSVDGRLLVAFDDGRVVVVNSADGQGGRSVELGPPVALGPRVYGKKILVSSIDGTLYRIESLLAAETAGGGE